MRRILGFGWLAIFAMGVGCSLPNQGHEKSKDKAASETAPEKEKTPLSQGSIKSTGDQNDQDSPDTTFLAESYIRDLLETDDSEAFAESLTKDEVAAGLALTGTDTASATATSTGADDAAAAAVAAAVSVGVNVALPMPGDADPTAHVERLYDLVVETIFGVADADGDGFLSEAEFVDTVYFGDGKISAEKMLVIKTRRAEWFAVIKGEANLVSPADLRSFLVAGCKYVKKLRLLRYLPYGKHLSDQWAQVKVKFDANGDGVLDKTELKAMRDARLELTADRRAAALAGSYKMCNAIVKNSGTLPDWFTTRELQWSKMLEVKVEAGVSGGADAAGPQMMDKLREKLTGMLGGFNVGVSVAVSASAQASAGSTSTSTSTATGTADEGEAACQSVVDRADAFGLAQKFTAKLHGSGLIFP